MKVTSETFPGAGLERHVCDNCRKPIVIAFQHQGSSGEYCSNKCLKEAEIKQENNTMVTEETAEGTATQTAPARTKKAAIAKGKSKKTAAKGKTKKAPKAKKGEAREVKVVGEPREGSKGAMVIAALKRAKGATLPDLEKVTGWNTNSIRGFLSTAGVKYKLKITSDKAEGKDRVYSAK